MPHTTLPTSGHLVQTLLRRKSICLLSQSRSRAGSSRRGGRRCKVPRCRMTRSSLLAHKKTGFARRYFTLYESGILSYAFEPGQPVRDQITLSSAAISTAPGRKDIHIDSNTATFHLKCLSQEDFDKWMLSLRSKITNLLGCAFTDILPGSLFRPEWKPEGLWHTVIILAKLVSISTSTATTFYWKN